MNLRSMTALAVATINPLVLVTIEKSSGYGTLPDGQQVPQYTTFANVPAQIQALSNDELKQVDGLNLQGNKQAIYFNGQWAGIVRADHAGGDLITFPDGTKWLVVIVLENWTDWTKLAVVQQL